MSFFKSLQRLFSWIGNRIMSFADAMLPHSDMSDLVIPTSEQRKVQGIGIVPRNKIAQQDIEKLEKFIEKMMVRFDRLERDVQELFREFALRRQEQCALSNQINSIKMSIIWIENEHKQIEELIEDEQQFNAQLRESNAELREFNAELRKSNAETRERLTPLEKDYAKLAADSHVMQSEMTTLEHKMQEHRNAYNSLLEKIRDTVALVFQLQTLCDRVVNAVQPEQIKGFPLSARTTYGILYRMHQAFRSMPIIPPPLRDNTEQDERRRKRVSQEALQIFECPITQQIMQAPVRTEGGHLNPAVILRTPSALLTKRPCPD
jgi:DNA repair exonuclease SbcCD ATPase subunit